MITTTLTFNALLFIYFMSTNFRGFLFNKEMTLASLKHMNFVISEFTKKPMPFDACSRLYCGDSAQTGVFARSARSSPLSVSVTISAEYRLLLGFSSNS